MAYQVQQLGNLVPTSAASTQTIGIGHLDDAFAVTIFVTSSANALSSAGIVQVCQFDPSDSHPVDGVTQSTAFHTLYLQSTQVGPVVVTSSGMALVISPVSFRGIRLTLTCSSSAEIIGYVSKQIEVP